jgi:hypothetical protein
MSRKWAKQQEQQINRYQTIFFPSQRGIVCSSVLYVENSEKMVTQTTAPCGHKPPIFPGREMIQKKRTCFFSNRVCQNDTCASTAY